MNKHANPERPTKMRGRLPFSSIVVLNDWSVLLIVLLLGTALAFWSAQQLHGELGDVAIDARAVRPTLAVNRTGTTVVHGQSDVSMLRAALERQAKTLSLEQKRRKAMRTLEPFLAMQRALENRQPQLPLGTLERVLVRASGCHTRTPTHQFVGAHVGSRAFGRIECQQFHFKVERRVTRNLGRRSVLFAVRIAASDSHSINFPTFSIVKYLPAFSVCIVLGVRAQHKCDECVT